MSAPPALPPRKSSPVSILANPTNGAAPPPLPPRTRSPVHVTYAPPLRSPPPRSGTTSPRLLSPPAHATGFNGFMHKFRSPRKMIVDSREKMKEFTRGREDGVNAGTGLATTTVTPPQSPRIHVFGMDLRQAVILTRTAQTRGQGESAARYWLPAIITRAISYLNKHGLDEEGIYRVPGSTNTVQRLRRAFEEGGDYEIDGEDETRGMEDPHAVASLLKAYLRELPSPLFPYESHLALNTLLLSYTGIPAFTIQASTPQTQPSSPPPPPPPSTTLPTALGHFLSKLPPYNFYLLRTLTHHLASVVAASEVNKMTISNLGLIFCPGLGISSVLFGVLVGEWEVVWGGVRCETEVEALSQESRERGSVA
ncbi:hypothetical protein YB2330_004564 [Saitoella coloradoensis]